MGEAKTKFEIARNISSNSIKENLLCSSDILKTSNNLLKNSLLERIDSKNYMDDNLNKNQEMNIYDLVSIKDALNKSDSINNKNILYSNEANNNVLNNEFSNGMLYDKIVMSNRNYNSAVDNLQNNFQGNNLTDVVNSIKFEENANIKIPSILKSSPLYVLYPELNNLREKEEKNIQIKEGIGNCNKNELFGELNGTKKLSKYLKDDLINNTLMKNKMYDYFELEKKNLVQIEGPNALSHKLLCSKSNEVSNVILNCYKNRYVTSNNNHINNELKTLNFLKEQKMPIVENNEKENIIMYSTNPRKKNILKGEENEEVKISKKKEKEFFISLIDTSNKTATLKTFDFKNNKEIKEKKNIFQKKKKPLKDVQVQTNEEELKKSTTNIIDSDVENVFNIVYKKKNELKSKNEKDKNHNNDKLKQESLGDEKEQGESMKYKISYNLTKQSDSSDDSNSDSEKKSNDSCSNYSNKSRMSTNKEEDDDADVDADEDKETKKKLDIKEHAKHYVECTKFGLPHNFLNKVYNKNLAFCNPSFINNNLSNMIKSGKMLNVNMDKNNKNWNNENILKKCSPTISNFLKIPYFPQYIPHIQNNMNGLPSNNVKDFYHNNLNCAYKNFLFPMNSQLKNASLNQRFLPPVINKGMPPFLMGSSESRNEETLRKIHKNNNIQTLEEDKESTINEENETSEEGKSEDEYEKSKTMDNLLLKKFYISQKKELYEKKKFQETFWSFLKNNDMLKKRTRGKFNSLRGTYYEYNNVEKDNALFLRKYKCWEEYYNKNINNMKNYFLDNNQRAYTKDLSNLKFYLPTAQSSKTKNNLDHEKRNHSQPAYNKKVKNKKKETKLFVKLNDILNPSTFPKEKSYLIENKKKEFEIKNTISKINLNEKYPLSENIKNSNKNILSKIKKECFNSVMPHPIKEESYHKSLKHNSKKEFRSLSYKNRLEKLNMLSKSIAPLKEVINKNKNLPTEKSEERKHFNSNEIELTEETKSYDDEKKENWELNKKNYNDKQNYQKKLNDTKITYSMKNTLKEDSSSKEKYHIKNKNSVENTSNYMPDTCYIYNSSHKEIIEKENIHLRTYENKIMNANNFNNMNDYISFKTVTTKDDNYTIEGENEKNKKNLNNKIHNTNESSNDHLTTYETKKNLNKTDNLLRVKVNIKNLNEKTVVSNLYTDESKKNDYFMNYTFQELDKNHKVEKKEKSANETIGNQKVININLLDEKKGSHKTKEMEYENNTFENQINKISSKTVPNAKNFLRKNNGSGGGNYSKIKQKNFSNQRGCTPLKSSDKNVINNNTTTDIDFNSKFSSSMSSGKTTELNEMINLETINPNKWVQEIFGNT